MLRRLVAEYLRNRRAALIAREYRKAYGEGKKPGGDFDGWSEEGAWPIGSNG